jgi:hypothetical protein
MLPERVRSECEECTFSAHLRDALLDAWQFATGRPGESRECIHISWLANTLTIGHRSSWHCCLQSLVWHLSCLLLCLQPDKASSMKMSCMGSIACLTAFQEIKATNTARLAACL